MGYCQDGAIESSLIIALNLLNPRYAVDEVDKLTVFNCCLRQTIWKNILYEQEIKEMKAIRIDFLNRTSMQMRSLFAWIGMILTKFVRFPLQKLDQPDHIFAF